MGIRKKEHRKKVAKRNQKISEEKKKFQKTYEAMMKEKFEELTKSFNQLDNVEVVDVIENGESVMEKPDEETTVSEN